MTVFILRRLAYGAVVVFIATILVFAMSRMAGDPRHLFLTEYTTQENWDEWGRQMGLDKPVPIQYFVWLGRAVRGDFGKSLKDQINALEVILRRFPATLQLTGAAFLVTIFTGVPLGVLSAVKRGSLWDYLGRTLALVGQATPAFWIGIMLILTFAVWIDWLPTGRRGGLSHYILPAITLGTGPAAGVLRLTRSAMLEVLDSEYVKFARAKGVSPVSVLWKHAFRNAMIAPLTYSGLIFAAFITGTVITETIFSWPGLGQLALQAVFNNDFPVLTGTVLIFTIMYVLINLLTDVSYALIDPRIRY